MRKLLVFLMLLMIGILPFAERSKAAQDAVDWDSAAALKRVNDIGNHLLTSSSLPEDVNFQVSEEDHVNAYASIDREVMVYRGLLNVIRDDDSELAAVISHEVGHITNAHAKKHLGIKIGIAAATVGAAVGDKYVKKPAFLDKINKYSPVPISISSAVGAAGTMAYNKISREDEFEADLTGVDLLVNAGYNPLAMISLLNKICGNYIDFFSTHPTGQRRIMNAYDYIAYNYPGAIEIGYESESYKRAQQLIQQNLSMRTAEDLREVEAKQIKLKREKEERAKTIKQYDDPWLLNIAKSLMTNSAKSKFTQTSGSVNSMNNAVTPSVKSYNKTVKQSVSTQQEVPLQKKHTQTTSYQQPVKSTSYQQKPVAVDTRNKTQYYNQSSSNPYRTQPNSVQKKSTNPYKNIKTQSYKTQSTNPYKKQLPSQNSSFQLNDSVLKGME